MHTNDTRWREKYVGSTMRRVPRFSAVVHSRAPASAVVLSEFAVFASHLDRSHAARHFATPHSAEISPSPHDLLHAQRKSGETQNDKRAVEGGGDARRLLEIDALIIYPQSWQTEP